MRLRPLSHSLLLIAALALATRTPTSAPCDPVHMAGSSQHHSAPATTTCDLGIACAVADVPVHLPAQATARHPATTPFDDALAAPAAVHLALDPPPPRA